MFPAYVRIQSINIRRHIERRHVNREKFRRVSTIFSLSLENEQADAGPDGRTRLARLNSQARTRTDSKTFKFSVQLATSSTGNLTRG